MSGTMRIVGVVVAGLVLFGCAATPQSPNSKPAASTAAIKDPNCLTQTGSNIPSGKSNCRGYGRSYSSDDIERTGQTSAGDALALLDPSITVHR
jgi:hypothetical protein